jgi:hypothetical protein
LALLFPLKQIHKDIAQILRKERKRTRCNNLETAPQLVQTKNFRRRCSRPCMSVHVRACLCPSMLVRVPKNAPDANAARFPLMAGCGRPKHPRLSVYEPSHPVALWESHRPFDLESAHSCQPPHLCPGRGLHITRRQYRARINKAHVSLPFPESMLPILYQTLCRSGKNSMQIGEKQVTFGVLTS